MHVNMHVRISHAVKARCCCTPAAAAAAAHRQRGLLVVVVQQACGEGGGGQRQGGAENLGFDAEHKQQGAGKIRGCREPGLRCRAQAAGCRHRPSSSPSGDAAGPAAAAAASSEHGDGEPCVEPNIGVFGMHGIPRPGSRWAGSVAQWRAPHMGGSCVCGCRDCSTPPHTALRGARGVRGGGVHLPCRPRPQPPAAAGWTPPSASVELADGDLPARILEWNKALHSRSSPKRRNCDLLPPASS